MSAERLNENTTDLELTKQVLYGSSLCCVTLICQYEWIIAHMLWATSDFTDYAKLNQLNVDNKLIDDYKNV